RLTTDNGLNLRLNPNDGSVVGGTLDGPINGLPGGSTGVSAAAYTNNFAGATATTLYTLDATSNSLCIQEPANNGTQTTIVGVTLGGAALDFDEVNGFDIPRTVTVTTTGAQATGAGLAALTVGGVASLYTIDLTTGVATLLVPAPPPTRGLTGG
ncbi:MAG: DUF4394 domain-containing protein, partial [Candidatus Eremiobacterota bacterium]